MTPPPTESKFDINLPVIISLLGEISNSLHNIAIELENIRKLREK